MTIEEGHTLEADPITLASSIETVLKETRILAGATADALSALVDTRLIPGLDKPFDAFILTLHDLPPLSSMLQEASTNCLKAPFGPPRSAQYAIDQSALLLKTLRMSLREFWGETQTASQRLKASRIYRLRVLLRLPQAAARFCDLVRRLEVSVTRLRHIITE